MAAHCSQQERSADAANAAHTSSPATLGLILAGGQGRRIGGRDKAWLRLHGRPLICHVQQRLQPQVTQVLVSANRHRWAYARLGLDSLADAPQWSQRGPLAAVASAWERHPTAWLAIVPVDCPLAPRDQVQRLRAALATGGHAAALRSGDRQQPLFGPLSPALATAAISALRDARPPSMRQWLDDQGAQWIDYPDPDGCVFANINRIDDLHFLERACKRD